MQSLITDMTKQNYLKVDQTSVLANLRNYIVHIIQKQYSQEFYFYSRCHEHIYTELLKLKSSMLSIDWLSEEKGTQGIPMSCCHI